MEITQNSVKVVEEVTATEGNYTFTGSITKRMEKLEQFNGIIRDNEGKEINITYNHSDRPDMQINGNAALLIEAGCNTFVNSLIEAIKTR